MLNYNSIKMNLFIFFIHLLKPFYLQQKIYRFEKALRYYVKMITKSTLNYTDNTSFVYPDITHKPWHESDENDTLKFVSQILENGYTDIADEWFNYLHSGYNIIPRLKPSEIFGESFKNKDEDWKYYVIWRHGKFTEVGLSLFPRTGKFISQLNCFLYSFGEVVFIVMKPGVVLPSHIDNLNISLTCQLGITIPKDCGIKVGGETRSWTRGKTLFFENSFEHEAWNQSQEDRVVLLLDLYHPELTNVEKALLDVMLKHLNFTG
ncbi:aspartyl/asparaginyl beta-hydroxylase domain-containing protein [Nostoc sp.]|uniref:aspartyl/asparaginyl beta-hydroxylase domain-containing protein n=1 Tax=Nostoc sp. TaxID=1180 RepID=UPI002FF50488